MAAVDGDGFDVRLATPAGGSGEGHVLLDDEVGLTPRVRVADDVVNGRAAGVGDPEHASAVDNDRLVQLDGRCFGKGQGYVQRPGGRQAVGRLLEDIQVRQRLG